MRDAPNVELRRQNSGSSDTTKGVDSYRQHDSGPGSRNLLRRASKGTLSTVGNRA